jgi:hypothetical protein
MVESSGTSLTIPSATSTGNRGFLPEMITPQPMITDIQQSDLYLSCSRSSPFHTAYYLLLTDADIPEMNFST